ncbi:hypothetical protein BKA62DRAFT_684740 [Auriculariales sp. MPI-PUGE-AT-0066]|nr:hypothetical protein BKA62DRAFT_684740 [Auriculariales sp. MPI-PUGE-AT-0066]
MTKLATHDIPPEIWLNVASHLSIQEICQLALLCRPFAALASQTRQRHLVISTTSNTTGGGANVAVVGESLSAQVAQRLQSRIDIGGIENVCRVTFFSFPRPDPGPRSKANAILEPQSPPPKSVGASRRFFKNMFGKNRPAPLAAKPNPPNLPALYDQFISVERLELLYDSGHAGVDSTRNLSFMCFPSIWTAWASNLRALSISVDTPSALRYYLRWPEAPPQLPRLEVFRFALLCVVWQQLTDSVSEQDFFKKLNQISRSASNSLQTLDIQYSRYSTYNSLRPFLGLQHWNVPVFTRLRKLSLTTTVYDHGFPPGDRDTTASITAFIVTHVESLREITVHGFMPAVEALVTRPPAFHPSTALSLNIDSTAAKEQLAIGRGTRHQELRGAVVELECKAHMFREVVELVEQLPNLRRLEMTMAWISLAKLAEVAQLAPSLVSLAIQHSMPDTDERVTVLAEQLSVDPSLGPTFAGWTLKDLQLYSREVASLRDQRESWVHMRYLARIIPSIVSFSGRGHMDQDGRNAWEHVWVWQQSPFVWRSKATDG